VSIKNDINLYWAVKSRSPPFRFLATDPSAPFSLPPSLPTVTVKSLTISMILSGLAPTSAIFVSFPTSSFTAPCLASAA